jgi:hypothetical protein
MTSAVNSAELTVFRRDRKRHRRRDDLLRRSLLCRRSGFMSGAFLVAGTARVAQQFDEDGYRGGIFYPLAEALP